jgi:hypothetical protein
MLGAVMSKWSLRENVKASVMTGRGFAHLMLTVAIIVAAAMINDAQIWLKIVIILATILAYFMSNPDFLEKKKRLE